VGRKTHIPFGHVVIVEKNWVVNEMEILWCARSNMSSMTTHIEHLMGGKTLCGRSFKKFFNHIEADWDKDGPACKVCKKKLGLGDLK
jgi:hypothetical protein